MAPWGKVLKDEQIAAILTYVRNEWGNKAPPITKDFVSKIREQTKDRTEPWTQKELQAIGRVLVEEAATGARAARGISRTGCNTGSIENECKNPGSLRGGPVRTPCRKPALAAAASSLRGGVYSLLALVLSFSSALAEPRTDNLYWAPPNFTTGGAQIDSILNFIFWLTLFVFIAVQAVFIFYLVKYRRRKGQPALLLPRQQCPGNSLDVDPGAHLSRPRHLQQPALGGAP